MQRPWQIAQKLTELIVASVHQPHTKLGVHLSLLSFLLQLGQDAVQFRLQLYQARRGLNAIAAHQVKGPSQLAELPAAAG